MVTSNNLLIWGDFVVFGVLLDFGRLVRAIFIYGFLEA
jgi:hypothetical protein